MDIYRCIYMYISALQLSDYNAIMNKGIAYILFRLMVLSFFIRSPGIFMQQLWSYTFAQQK